MGSLDNLYYPAMTIAEWVRAARASQGWSLQVLGDLIGRSKGAVGHWENGINEPNYELIVKIHELTNYPMPGSALKVSEPGASYRGAAHLMSLSSFETPPTITWGEIMNPTTVFPASFVCAVPDDALSPLTPKGTRLVFETGGEPMPGVGVLIADRDGNRYIRRFVRGAGDRWIAASSNQAYAPLNSIDDGLIILAVASGRLDGSV